MHFSRKQEVFCPIVVGLYPPLDNRESRSADVFTQTCHFTVCGLRYFKLESSHCWGRTRHYIPSPLAFSRCKIPKIIPSRALRQKLCPLIESKHIFFSGPNEKDRQRGFPRHIFHLPNLKMGINKRNSQNK